MKKTICILLAAAMVFSLMAVPVFGETTKAKQTERSIAIVFDNSGSMYSNNRKSGKAWCQAIYAMEVFASMMNEGDTLEIYPMWPIETDSGTFDMDHPLRISNPSEAKVIRSIYTPEPLNTPISAIEAAYRGLKKAKGEQWLIVLTDGETFMDDDGNDLPNTVGSLNSVLSGYNKEMNTLYLGIGANAAMPGLSKSGTYVYKEDKASDSEQILQKLTDMCNMIFGRDAIPNAGKNLDLKVSMTKVFVFVQGPNISNVSLSGESGNTVASGGSEFMPHYGEKGCGPVKDGGQTIQYDYQKDTSLQGVIKTFQNVPKGSYTLNYDGNATSIEVYYEPNVDIEPRLVNPEGKVVETEEDLIPGEYTISYGLLDGETKEPADMSLLGGDASYHLEYTVNGEKKTSDATGAGGTETIVLNAGDKLELDSISAEFLKDYQITKRGIDFGFPWNLGDISIRLFQAGTLELKLSEGQDNYHLSKIEEEAPFKAELLYDGERLEGEALKNVELEIDLGGKNLLVEQEVRGSDILLSLRYPDAAHPENTDTGEITLTVKAAYTPENTETAEESAGASFNIENDVTGLGAELVLPKSGGYTHAELSGSTLYVNLRMGGQMLTEQEMSQLTHTVTLQGPEDVIPVEVEKDAENSRLILRPNAEGAATGKYTLNVLAITKNQLGQDARATAETQIKVQLLPTWLVLLIWLLALLLLAALIWFILSRRILPKRINVSNTSFMVDGEEIRGEASAKFHDGGKKFGHISINSPSSPTNPLAKCSISMNLEASDTRFKVLRCRLRKNTGSLTAMRTKLTSSIGVTTVKMSGVTTLWDENHKIVVSPVDPEENPRVLLSNDGRITVLAEVMDEYGGTVDVSLAFTMHFQ